MSSLVQIASVSMSSSCTLTFRSPRCLQIQDSSTYGNSSFHWWNFRLRLMKIRKKIMKKLKSTLKRKLNPIIRCEGGRKFFFPTKDNVHKCFKNSFLHLMLVRYLPQWSCLFCLFSVMKEHFPFTEFGIMYRNRN